MYRLISIKEFRNSSWYQSQFSETLIPSGHLLFRPSFIPAKSLWPSLIPVISPCSQSQGRKRFPVGRIVVRKHSPPATFPVNFSDDGFFYTARSAWRRSPICPKAPEPETHPRALFPAGDCISRARA